MAPYFVTLEHPPSSRASRCPPSDASVTATGRGMDSPPLQECCERWGRSTPLADHPRAGQTPHGSCVTGSAFHPGQGSPHDLVVGSVASPRCPAPISRESTRVTASSMVPRRARPVFCHHRQATPLLRTAAAPPIDDEHPMVDPARLRISPFARRGGFLPIAASVPGGSSEDCPAASPNSGAGAQSTGGAAGIIQGGMPATGATGAGGTPGSGGLASGRGPTRDTRQSALS